MPGWSFLTNHARALAVLADDADMRLRDLALVLGVTERTACGIVADLTEAGFVVKAREGRRNRYRVHTYLPIGDRLVAERSVADTLGIALQGRRSSDGVA